MRRTAALSVLITIAAVLFCVLTGNTSFAVAAAVTMPISLLALVILANDVQNAFMNKQLKKITLKFIFRLACFAVLLYLILVRLKLSPYGSVLGLSIPLLSMMAVLLYTIRQEAAGQSHKDE